MDTFHSHAAIFFFIAFTITLLSILITPAVGFPVDKDSTGSGLIPRTTTPFTKCPTVTDIVHHINSQKGFTGKNNIFWSDPGDVSLAKTVAHSPGVNGAFIQDVVNDKDIGAWSKLCTAEERSHLWERASYAFAMVSEENAYIVTCPSNTEPADRIWTKYEFPVLKATKKVKRVYCMDNKDAQKQTVIWDSSHGYGNYPPEP